MGRILEAPLFTDEHSNPDYLAVRCGRCDELLAVAKNLHEEEASYICLDACAPQFGGGEA